MALRLAFAGFRHYHVMEAYEFAQKMDGFAVTAAAEDDAATRRELEAKGVRFTHSSVLELLDDLAGCDAVVVGDYFGRRGSLAIRAMEAGKHVLLDKPIATRLEEMDRISSLSGDRGLAVGCQLTLRDVAQTRTLRRLVREGAIGRVATASFMGQHPLRFGTRPGWYFEEGKHGGTINDIAVHGVDFLMWALQDTVAEVVAARVWNDLFPQHADFQLCAQLMLRMAAGTGVFGDVSYTGPDEQGYGVPQYWRFTLHGERGVLETSMTTTEVCLWQTGKNEVVRVKLDPARPGGYLEDFRAEVEGRAREAELTTAQVLSSSRATLQVQEAADRGATGVVLG